MMGPGQEAQGALFYDFSLEEHVPADHLLRSVDRFVDLSGIRCQFAAYYSATANLDRPGTDNPHAPDRILHGYPLGTSPV